VNALEEVIVGIGASIFVLILAMFWFAPSAIMDFLPKLWRTWKGKRIGS
jgi:hypothetical protein